MLHCSPDKRLLGEEQAGGQRGQGVHRAPGGDLHRLTTGSSALAYRNLVATQEGRRGQPCPRATGSQEAQCARKQDPRWRSWASARMPGRRTWNKVESPSGPQFPLGTHGTIVSVTARRGSGQTQGPEASRKKAPQAQVVHGIAGHHRESPECQTQQSGFTGRQSGATEGFGTGEGSGQLRPPGGSSLGAPAWAAAGAWKEWGARFQGGRVGELQVQAPWGPSRPPLPPEEVLTC